MEDTRFIETPDFPVKEVSEQSAKEKQGGGRPPHWEMVFWWTRKPLASARAIIAGALLPAGIDKREFIRAMRLNENVAHRHNPAIPEEWRKYFEGKTLLDPFAGFGSIPLEALRLGLSATAVELLPTAYVFLKAVLEYPLKYGGRMKEVSPEEVRELRLPTKGRRVPELLYDVAKWGKWVTDRLREDPDIKELYEDDVAVYIGTWEIKCPHCGRWTPLVGNWWLARVKDSKGQYKRLAWMEPYVEGDEVKIRVRDLNKELGKIPSGTKVDTKAGKITLPDGRAYNVPSKNVSNQSSRATCLLCGGTIGKEIELDLPDSEFDWYVKQAIYIMNVRRGRDYARERLLVKVKVEGGDLIFEPCTKEDHLSLSKAENAIKQSEDKGDPDLPYEKMTPYGGVTLGDIPKLYKLYRNLFNSRQLLTLVKLVKLIREAGKKVEEEKIKEEWSKEEAFKYAEAVAVYLTLALARYVDYNTLCTVWNYGGQLPAQVAHTLSMRGIAMMWNWGDVSPFVKISGTGTWLGNLSKLLKLINYLHISFSAETYPPLLVSEEDSASEKLRDRVTILIHDATEIAKLKEGFLLIVTDPPYYDDVPYAELSDFYYVWLKRALSDLHKEKLVPRFLKEAFFKEVRGRYIEIPTQWEEFAQREVSLNVGRLGPNATKEDAIKHFQNLLNSSFLSMSSLLADDGLLVTYYAHTSPEAWKALLKAGWEVARMRVTNAFPLVTESAQRVTARGKLSLDTSIVVVWRKGSSGKINASELYERMIDSSANRATEMLDRGVIGADLLVSSLAAALSAATRFEEVIDIGKLDTYELVDKYVYPATMLGIVRGVSRKSGLKDGVSSPESMFYLIVKVLLRGLKRKKLSSNDARIIALGTSVDLKKLIDRSKILSREKSELSLLDPTSTERGGLERFLLRRGLEPNNPVIRNSVDALHLLEYYSVAYSGREFKDRLEELRTDHPREVQEAISMAKILASVLPTTDPEGELASRVVGRVRQGVLPVG